MKKRLLRILIVLTIILAILGFIQKSRGRVLGTKADVVGDLKFTYPHGTTPERLFNEADFKPGDCKTATVGVENLAGSNSIVGVFSDTEVDSDSLSSALTIEIGEEVNPPFYGPLPLSQFFLDSDVINQINLVTLAGNASTNLNFKVCFPDTNDNELQGDSVIFDLNFGQIKPPVELPEVCKDLEGIVTEKIEGTEGNDAIVGTTASELILGYGGNDHIRGGGGSDCIIGGEGSDSLEGGSGNDILEGGGGADNIKGGSGIDLVYGNQDNDDIDTGSGNDSAYGNEGDDTIKGGDGNDALFGDKGSDTLMGGSGLDELFGEEGDDIIFGGSGNDKLDGGLDHDVLTGNAGIDTCEAGETYNSCEF